MRVSGPIWAQTLEFTNKQIIFLSQVASNFDFNKANTSKLYKTIRNCVYDLYKAVLKLIYITNFKKNQIFIILVYGCHEWAVPISAALRQGPHM